MNNLKEKAIILGITALVFGGIVWLATPSTKISSGADVSNTVSKILVTQENKYNFGAISMAAGKVTHVFAFKNSDSEPLTVSTVYTSCMCTAATLIIDGVRKGPFGMPGHGFLPKLSEVVAPGAEIQVEVVFDPAAHGPAGIGSIARTVAMETSSGVAEMSFSATVTP